MGFSFKISDKVSNSTKIRLLAVIAAIAVHGLLLLITFSVKSFVAEPQGEVLKVTLLVEQPERKVPDAKEAPDQVPPMSQDVPKDNAAQNTKLPLLISPQTVITALNDNDAQEKQITVSALDVTAWANIDASKFIDEQSRPRLSGLRKGSYEQRLLDPNRIDQRTSPKIDKISTQDGVIHTSKIRGRTVCGMDSSRNVGSAFNGLDLKPLSGQRSSYACGDTKRTNVLLDDNNKIKNSDAEKWSIND